MDASQVPRIIEGPCELVTIPAGASLVEAARKMRDKRVDSLVVSNRNHKVIGIITERDFVHRVVAAMLDPRRTRVHDVMTSPVISVSPEDSVAAAQQSMAQHDIRHMPILEDGEMVGMLSARDVVACQLATQEEMREATEQIARLSASMKSLNLDEILQMAVQKVPEVFQADRCVICLPEAKSNSPEGMSVVRRDCRCPLAELKRRLKEQEAASAEEMRVVDCPSACREKGGTSPSLLIPLRMTRPPERSEQAGKTHTGYLCMCCVEDGPEPSSHLLQYKASLVYEILSANLSKAHLYEQTKRSSLTDPLTGTGTRRFFEEKLQAECVRAKRYGRPFCVALLDVDHFKSINDRLGHTAGDRALRTLGMCLSREKRACDVLARYGGDEFIILMPETAREDGLAVVERIRSTAEQVQMPDGVHVTLSCGLAEQPAGYCESANELIRRADLALYEAKRRGRNRVETWADIASRLREEGTAENHKLIQLRDHIAGLSIESKEMFIQSISGLAQALAAKDAYSRNHSENVTRYAVAIAETMGLDPDYIATIRRAAILHDIGKIGVPDAVLLKPEQLTQQERRIMEQHPLTSVSILQQMRFLEQEIPIVRHHHERWDGQGYPDGISGTNIPLGARILAVADAFDAITSERVYRRSQSVRQAVQALRGSSGYQFDPEVVEAMIQWIDSVGRELNKEELTTEDLLASQEACAVTI